MDAHEQLSSSLARQRSQGLEWPNCTSTMCIDGSDYHQRSSPTETPASPRTSDACWPTKLGPSKTCQWCFTLKPTDFQRGRTNGSNSTCASLQMRSRKIGVSGLQWHPQCTTITSMPPWE